MTKITGILHEYQYTLMIISRSFLLRMRNFRDKICIEDQNTHFMFNKSFFEYSVVYEIMWKSFVESERPQTTAWRMRIACRIPNATNAHSEHVILIAFALQWWLHEHASMLRYTYTAWLVDLANEVVGNSDYLTVSDWSVTVQCKDKMANFNEQKF